MMFSLITQLRMSAQNVISRQALHTFHQRMIVKSGKEVCPIMNRLYQPNYKHCAPKLNMRSIHISEKFSNSNKITIYFVDRHGEKHKAEATVGDSLLDVVIDNDLNFETYGVCEGTISCSTCHVILDENSYSDLEDPLMDEMDMLDLACGLTETSRLGCQVYVTKEMDGLTVKLPEEITDARDL